MGVYLYLTLDFLNIFFNCTSRFRSLLNLLIVQYAFSKPQTPPKSDPYRLDNDNYRIILHFTANDNFSFAQLNTGIAVSIPNESKGEELCISTHQSFLSAILYILYIDI